MLQREDGGEDWCIETYRANQVEVMRLSRNMKQAYENLKRARKATGQVQTSLIKKQEEAGDLQQIDNVINCNTILHSCIDVIPYVYSLFAQ